MRFISTQIHGVLDYLSAVLLIAAPWLFGFEDVTTAKWVAVIAGVLILLMSIFTKYELGMIRSIPMATHLSIDVVTGVVLAASPWIFGFAESVFWPHLLIGLLEIGAGIFTHKMPYSTEVHS